MNPNACLVPNTGNMRKKFKNTSYSSSSSSLSFRAEYFFFFFLASDIILTYTLFSSSFPLEMFFWLAFQDFKILRWSEVYSKDTFLSPDSFVKWDHYSHVTEFALSLNQYFFHREVAGGISGKAVAVRENEFEQKWGQQGHTGEFFSK